MCAAVHKRKLGMSEPRLVCLDSPALIIAKPAWLAKSRRLFGKKERSGVEDVNWILASNRAKVRFEIFKAHRCDAARAWLVASWSHLWIEEKAP